MKGRLLLTAVVIALLAAGLTVVLADEGPWTPIDPEPITTYNPHLTGSLPVPIPGELLPGNMVNYNPHLTSALPVPIPKGGRAFLYNPHLTSALPVPIPGPQE